MHQTLSPGGSDGAESSISSLALCAVSLGLGALALVIGFNVEDHSVAPIAWLSATASVAAGACYALSGVRARRKRHPKFADAAVNAIGRSRVISELQGLPDLARDAEGGWLLLINLDRFGIVNVAMGHDKADALLDSYLTSIGRALPAGGRCWRLHADEYVVHVCKPGVNVTTVAAQIHRAVSLVRVASINANLVMTCSMGIVDFGAHGKSASDHLRLAAAALRKAKGEGGGGTVMFEPALLDAANRKLQLECDLRRAIVEGHLQVYLQSQVTASGEVLGAECLLRWVHPERGVIAPGEFMQIAEESDLIVEIGNMVIHRACELQARLRCAASNLRLSVNISPRQFMKANFCETLLGAVGHAGADATKIVLEVTEGLVLRDLNEVRSKMNYLVSMGFVISLDDFGTGYSSFSYLKTLPVREMKIPRTFLLMDDASGNAVMRAMMQMACHMELGVVSEGVETAEELKRLRSLGGDYLTFQGFLFARPIPAEQWMAQVEAPATHDQLVLI